MQAARGTSVDPLDGAPEGSDEPAAGPAAPGTARRAKVILVLVAAVLYAVDLTTKILALEHLRGRADVPLVGDLLQLRFATNPGAAFSAGTAFTEALSVFAILAAAAVGWTARRVGSNGWAVALGLLLAGILGNLTDRMVREPGPFRGEVVDFLMLPHWPIFNVADMCINAGAVLVLVLAWRGVRLDGTRASRRPDDDAPAGEVPRADPDDDADATDGTDETGDGARPPS